MAAPVDTRLAPELRLQITRLHRRLRLRTATGLTSSQVSMIAALRASGPTHLGQLAQLEGITAPTTTRAVERLAELGLVSRTPDADDARRLTIELTPAGRRTARRSDEAASGVLSEALSRRSAAELAALAAALPALQSLVADLSEQ